MKKMIFQFLVAIAILSTTSLAFSITYATGTLTDDGTPDLGDITIQLSPNVGYYYKSDSTGDSFVLMTSNTKGSKTYGTSQNYTGIYQILGKDYQTAPTPSSAPNWSGWGEVGK